MPVLSYIHHLFDVNQCHAYIHTLRWKERPLQCPRCQSQDKPCHDLLYISGDFRRLYPVGRAVSLLR